MIGDVDGPVIEGQPAGARRKQIVCRNTTALRGVVHHPRHGFERDVVPLKRCDNIPERERRAAGCGIQRIAHRDDRSARPQQTPPDVDERFERATFERRCSAQIRQQHVGGYGERDGPRIAGMKRDAVGATVGGRHSRSKVHGRIDVDGVDVGRAGAYGQNTEEPDACPDIENAITGLHECPDRARVSLHSSAVGDHPEVVTYAIHRGSGRAACSPSQASSCTTCHAIITSPGQPAESVSCQAAQSIHSRGMNDVTGSRPPSRSRHD